MKNFEQIKNNLVVFADRIKELGGEVIKNSIKNPAELSQIESLEKELGFMLPNELRDFFLNASAGIEYYWSIYEVIEENEAFLPDEFGEIFSGILLISIDLMLQYKKRYQELLEIAFSDIENEYCKILHNKLLFQKVMNGDWIAIDLESENYGKIVYLSHDGSENHGRIMANGFYEFLENYTAIGCTGGEDWQWEIFCDKNGIDGNGEMAIKWRAFLNVEI